MSKPILDLEHFVLEYCEYRHVYEDQEFCLSCYGEDPNECEKAKTNFERYKEATASSEALFVMMQVL